MPQLPLDEEANSPNGSWRPGFFSWVAITMAALHLKERWDEYRRRPLNEYTTLPPAYDDGEQGEIASQIPLDSNVRRRTRPRRTPWCFCCGIDCTLLFKATMIVLLVWFAWTSFKIIRWGLTPARTGLEDMPEYSTSLGCSSGQYVYEGGALTVDLPVTIDRNIHTVTVSGAAPGTILLTQGPSGYSAVDVKATIRTDTRSTLERISLKSDGLSTIELRTPVHLDAGCARFDLTVTVPEGLKSLTFNLESTTQLKFDPTSTFFPLLEELIINSPSKDPRAMILPDYGIKARLLSISARAGWIVGDISVSSDLVQVDTRGGNAVTNINVTPGPALVVVHDKSAHLVTYSGSGRTDVVYHNDEPPSPFHKRRSINSTHIASVKSDMYLTYKDPSFNGLVDIKASSYSARNLHTMSKDAHKNGKASHWYGDMDGPDLVKIESARSGWVGVCF